MFVAKETFVARTANGEVVITAGVTVVADTDEVYWRYQEKFEAIERPVVEQATANPGEKRGKA